MSNEAPSSTPHDAGPERGEQQVVETPIEARQAERGVPMFWVVIVSTVIAAVILFLLVIFSGVFAPAPTTGRTPNPQGPFSTQVNRQQTPRGSEPATGGPSTNGSEPTNGTQPNTSQPAPGKQPQ